MAGRYLSAVPHRPGSSARTSCVNDGRQQSSQACAIQPRSSQSVATLRQHRSPAAIRLRRKRRHWQLADSDDAHRASNGAGFQPILPVPQPSDGLPGASHRATVQCGSSTCPFLNGRPLIPRAIPRTPEPWVMAQLDGSTSNRNAPSMPRTGAAVASNRRLCTNREWCPESLVDLVLLMQAGRTETLT
jgi:hypothetical protein